MFLTPPNLPHYLMARGHLAADAVVNGVFRAVESRRRNRNFKVWGDEGQGLFVKQVAAARPDAVQTLYREATCYQLADDEDGFAALARVTPKLHGYDPSRHVLVIELLPDGENLTQHHHRLGALPAEIGRLVGEALGAVHAGAADMLAHPDHLTAFPRMLPPVLAIVANASNPMLELSGGNREILDLLHRTPGFTERLGELCMEWQRDCFIHGDLKWDNIVVTGGDDRTLRIVDWELADVGDAAWDAGAVLAAYLQQWILVTGATPAHGPVASMPAHAATSLETIRPAVEALWRAYVETSGLRAEDASESLRRSVRYGGARLVQTAFELLWSEPTLSPAALALLQHGLNVMNDPVGAARDLLGLDPGGVPAGTRLASTRAEPDDDAPAVRAERKVFARAGKIPVDLDKRLRTLLDAVHIDGLTRFRFGDGPPFDLGPMPGPGGFPLPTPHANGRPRDGATTPPAPHEAEAMQRLAHAMVPVVYGRGYARVFDPNAPPADLADETPAWADPGFVGRLTTANRGESRWDPGWQVYGLDPAGVVHARKGDRYRALPPGEFAFGGMTPFVGAEVAALAMRESSPVEGGFYYAFGETLASQFDNLSTIRLYFNSTPETTPALMEHLTDELNRYEVPFGLKCLNLPLWYDRIDACVLYVADPHVGFTLRSVARLPDEVRRGLGRDVPLFTRAMQPGIGLAEDPGTGESFGQSRVGLLCRGLVDAWWAGEQTTGARLRAVRTAFAARGLDLAQPHLNGGSRDRFEWPA